MQLELKFDNIIKEVKTTSKLSKAEKSFIVDSFLDKMNYKTKSIKRKRNK